MKRGWRARWIAAVFTGATLTVSCSPAPPRPQAPAAGQLARAGVGASDEILTSAVYSELNADPIYYFRHVEVKVHDGVADLSGYVWSTNALYRARKVASSVPGVTGVTTSQLQLERNGRDTGPAR